MAKDLQAEVIELRAVRDALIEAHKRRGSVLTSVCGDDEAVTLAWMTLEKYMCPRCGIVEISEEQNWCADCRPEVTTDATREN